ncbi:MAG TPA: DUF1801 domain-containing protein [Thermomicrobiaceae bacterium]|nr:DUF1801 domain-containing protein [Thermomicrobiaceae bacterium]
MTDTKQPRKRGAGTGSEGFSDEERAAMRERAREVKAGARRGSRAADVDTTAEVLAKIADMQESDRLMAGRLHALITAAAPELTPKTWYGMPAYYRDGQMICYFKDARKFKTRYATLGFSDKAHLDDGPMWPAEYAVLELTPEAEARIVALLEQALS